MIATEYDETQMTVIEEMVDRTGEPSSILLKRLNDYTVVPDDKIKDRMRNFYGPYNGFFNMQKHMDFEDGPKIQTPTDNNW